VLYVCIYTQIPINLLRFSYKFPDISEVCTHRYSTIRVYGGALSCQVPNFVCHRISSVSRIVTTYHKADMKNVCFLHMRNRLRKLQPLLRSVHTFTDCSWKAPSGTAACNCCVTPRRLLHAQQHRYCIACQQMPLLLLLLCYRLAAEALMCMCALCTRYC
jgi:hypothetical protein